MFFLACRRRKAFAQFRRHCLWLGASCRVRAPHGSRTAPRSCVLVKHRLSQGRHTGCQDRFWRAPIVNSCQVSGFSAARARSAKPARPIGETDCRLSTARVPAFARGRFVPSAAGHALAIELPRPGRTGLSSSTRLKPWHLSEPYQNKMRQMRRTVLSGPRRRQAEAPSLVQGTRCKHLWFSTEIPGIG
jgi:hypothetical protein